MTGDPTRSLIWSMDHEPDKWDVRRGIVGFIPHEREVRDANGKLVKKIRVTAQDLPRIAADANQRIATSGQLDTLTIGHRKFHPDAKETEQPPLVGFCRNYRVEIVQRPGGAFPALVYDEYAAKDRAAHYDLYRQYPFRSIEYDPALGTAGVAALTRPPFLNMGTVYVYQRSDMPEPTIPNPMLPDDVANYEAEGASIPDDDGTFQNYCRYMHKYMAKYGAPWHKKYSMGAMGPTNPAMPGSPEPSMPTGYQAYSAAFQAEIDKMRAENAALRKAHTESEANRLLDTIEGVVQFDRQRELRTLLTYQSPADMAAHITYMRQTYQPTPAGVPMVPVYQGYTSPTQPDNSSPYYAPPNHAKAMAYIMEHPGTSYEAALAATK